MLRAAKEAKVNVDIAIDNTAVVSGVRRRLRGNHVPAGQSMEWWQVIEQCLGALPRSRVLWVPSHGKKEGWAPPPQFAWTAGTVRHMNQEADTAATDAMEAAWKKATPERTHRERSIKWANQQVRRLQLASEKLVASNGFAEFSWR